MIEKCSDEKIIYDYIGRDFGKCLYLFIDLVQYGLDKDYFTIWLQINENNEISSLISRYYDGFQIFSKNNEFNEKETAGFIKKYDFSMIVGMEDSLRKISPMLSDRPLETGYVGQFAELRTPPHPEAYRASADDIKEIAELLACDPALGKPYGYEKLVSQFHKRFEDDFGRSYLLRDKKDNKIICHAATYAETKELAVISGVITAPEYRGKGYSKSVLAALCEELHKENKKVFSYYYIPAAIKMHHGTGFEDIGRWAKIVK